MHGNVLEWCADWVHPDYEGAPKDGLPWNYSGVSSSRIARGGSYLFNPDIAKSSARYSTDVNVTFSGFGFRLAVDVQVSILDPKFQSETIANAASGIAVALSPAGAIVTIKGTNIGPTKPASPTLKENGRVGADLSETQVLFDGVPAPLLYVSSDHINAVVPYSVDGQTTSQVIIINQGQSSMPVTVLIIPSSPAIFTVNSAGQGQGAILNQDGSYNSANNPAQKGSVVGIFATGEGQTNPPGVDGKLATAPLPLPVLTVEVSIGGAQAEVLYAGAATDEIAGVFQINAKIPQIVSSGQHPIVLRVGSANSQPEVFVSAG